VNVPTIPAEPVEDRPGRWRFLIGLIVLAVLIVVPIATAVVVYDRMVRSNAEQQVQNTADLAAVFLQDQDVSLAALTESVVQDAALAAALTNPDAGEQQESAIDQVLRTLRGGGPDIVTVAVLDAQDRVLGDLPDRVPDGYDVSDQSWLPQTVDDTRYTVSALFRSPITGNDVSAITVPIRAADGDLLGHVAVIRTADGYQRYVDSYASGRGVRMSVVDAAGQLVADSDGAAPEGLSAQERLDRGTSVLAGSGRIVAVSPSAVDAVPVSGWRVVVGQDEATAMATTVFFRAAASAAAAVLLIGALVVAVLRRRATGAARQINRSLAENQQRMRDLADSSPGVLLRLDLSGTVGSCSVAGDQVFGIPAADLVGRELAPFLMAESEPGTASRLEVLARTGEQQEFLARTRGPDGSRRIVECNFRIRTVGEPEIWGSLQDVTDRLSARDQVEQLFQLSADFMAVADFTGRLVQTNPVWSASLGVPVEHLLGHRFEAVFHAEDERRVGELLARLTSEPGVATFENRYIRDGSVRTLLWTAASDPDRRLIYAVGRDITAQKELQNALAETRDQAVEASRLKSEFVATMSHEIRTPMNGVIGLTDLLLGTPLTETQRRYVEGVRTAGDALLTVINDILDFSKIEAGRMLLDRVDFRLEDVVDDVVTLVRQNAVVKGLDLTVDYAPGAPFALNGDPGRLRQILLNLTHNAVKFTERGGVSISVRPGGVREDGQVAVHFEIADTGIGIDPTRLGLLFEPFRQADEGTSRAYGGTGLGLSISRRLADMMGGTIRATSELGQGTSFVAELVFAPASEWGRSVRGRDARGLAVLVVDDNEVNCLVMTTQLSRWGMRPVAAGSAAEAMDLLTNRSAPAGGYDLMVVDMHMPQEDGLDLIRQVREVPVLAGLPVILVTSGEEVGAEAIAEHGISARLTKPVRQSDLFGALTRVSLPNAGSARPDPTGSTPPEHPEQSALAADSSTSSTRQLRLLLVEDNDINQTVALGILAQLGYQVDVAEHGEQALRMTEQHSYDAILMDCQMPVMDGYTATVEMRRRPATRRVPVIAMTAATFAADRQRCFDSGMDDFIAKPVRSSTLQATLNRWLRPASPDRPASLDRTGVATDEHQDRMREQVAAIRDGEQVDAPTGGSRSVPPTGTGLPRQTRPADAESTRQVRSPQSARATQNSQSATSQDPPAQDLPAQDLPGRTPLAQTSADPGRQPTEIADTDERIAELLGGGSDFEIGLVRDIIASFLSRTVDLIQRLGLAISVDDSDAAYLHAHSLAGAGLNLGTVRMVGVARQIEAAARAGRAGQCGQLLVDLEVALDQARAQLQEIASNLPEIPDPADGADQADPAGWAEPPLR